MLNDLDMEDIKDAIGDDDEKELIKIDKEAQDVMELDKEKKEEAEEVKKEQAIDQEAPDQEDENPEKTVKAGKSLLADGEVKPKKKVTW